MKFISKGYYWNEFKNLALNAISVKIAVAYFSPDDEMINLLTRIPKLTLVISEEFNINNPEKIEKINNGANSSIVRSYNPKNGRLHSKIFIFQDEKGNKNCIIGSANLTHLGMKDNNEAGIRLNSIENSDMIGNIEYWYTNIFNNSDKIDFENAKKIFKNSRESTSIVARNIFKDRFIENHFWILKTTSGSTGEEHWGDFIGEGVVAIGWNVSASKQTTVNDLIKKISRVHSSRAAEKVRKFIDDIKPGDYIAIIRGYPPEQFQPVHIYGLAMVKSGFIYDLKSSWWEHKKEAKIKSLQINVPVELMRSTFGLDSCLQAIHGPFSIDTIYQNFIATLHDELGIEIDL